MKVYKVELMILDFDEIGPEQIKEVIEYQKFPNRCISPDVIRIDDREIGEWDDDCDLNKSNKCIEAFNKLFEEQHKSEV